MNLRHPLLAALLFVAPAVFAADKNDDPNAKYKAAMARNDIEGATAAYCDAAKADPKKWEKKCASAQQYSADQLASYEPLFAAGKAEYQRGDYPAAARDLGKIYFGPRHEEAQKLAHDAATYPQRLVESRQAYAAAQTAYDGGDFTAASADAHKISVPEMHSMAQQLLNNIATYEDSIRLGDAALQHGNFAEAQQRYAFAVKIKANGPGDPSGKLQKVASLLALSKTPAKSTASTKVDTPSTPGPSKLPVQVKTPSDNSVKIKAALADAHAAEGRKNVEAALAAYQRALALDPRQVEALAGRKTLLDAAQKDSQGMETHLAGGIRSFYQAHLVEASDAISLYLNAGGGRYKGAAHFYLGATLAAKALLASPAEQAGLRQSALQEFQLARGEHYNPVESLVAPKILALWKQSAV